MKKWLFSFMEFVLSKLSDKIIVSENEEKQAIKLGLCPKSKFENINNAIDFNDYPVCYSIQAMKKELGITGRFVVGAIGRLEEQKDWETYVFAAYEVLKVNPDVNFLIVGKGALIVALKRMIEKLGIEDKVIVTGYIESIEKVYAVIDVFVNTSLWEGLPYVFLEAMYYKKPIIATDIGNDQIVIENETGYLIKVKNHWALAQKILKLIEEKTLVSEMGENGFKYLLEKFSFQAFVESHEVLYKRGTHHATY